MQFFLHKTTNTIACLIAFSLLPFVVPSLQRWRMTMPQSAIIPTEVLTVPITVESRPGEIEDASGQALQHFFAALNQTQNGKGIVRISHYGDSPITGDMITSTVRRKLQLQFGDAGHGFVLLAKPWGWYQHLGVKHEASG